MMDQVMSQSRGVRYIRRFYTIFKVSVAYLAIPNTTGNVNTRLRTSGVFVEATIPKEIKIMPESVAYGALAITI